MQTLTLPSPTSWEREIWWIFACNNKMLPRSLIPVSVYARDGVSGKASTSRTGSMANKNLKNIDRCANASFKLYLTIPISCNSGRILRALSGESVITTNPTPMLNTRLISSTGIPPFPIKNSNIQGVLIRSQ